MLVMDEPRGRSALVGERELLVWQIIRSLAKCQGYKNDLSLFPTVTRRIRLSCREMVDKLNGSLIRLQNEQKS